jgi:type II secretory pathway component GspD/PulD (secretin)
MKKVAVILIVLFCAHPAIAIAEGCNTTLPPLVDLLNQYSKAQGTKFVIDPRVSAKVTLVGIDTSALDSATLIGILNIYGFTALTSNGVVYVMPDRVAIEAGDKFGRTWGG